MNKALAGIFLIVIVIALSIFLYYQMLDRKKFTAAAYYMKALDEPLGEWLSEAVAEGTGLFGADDGRQRLEICLDGYEKTRALRSEQKTLLVNEAYGILRRACACEEGDPRTVERKARLNDRIEELLDAINQYNHYVRAYNKKLKTRTGAVIADLLHLKYMTVLDDLRL